MIGSRVLGLFGKKVSPKVVLSKTNTKCIGGGFIAGLEFFKPLKDNLQSELTQMVDNVLHPKA